MFECAVLVCCGAGGAEEFSAKVRAVSHQERLDLFLPRRAKTVSLFVVKTFDPVVHSRCLRKDLQKGRHPFRLPERRFQSPLEPSHVARSAREQAAGSRIVGLRGVVSVFGHVRQAASSA